MHPCEFVTRKAHARLHLERLERVEVVARIQRDPVREEHGGLGEVRHADDHLDGAGDAFRLQEDILRAVDSQQVRCHQGEPEVGQRDQLQHLHFYRKIS